MAFRKEKTNQNRTRLQDRKSTCAQPLIEPKVHLCAAPNRTKSALVHSAGEGRKLPEKGGMRRLRGLGGWRMDLMGGAGGGGGAMASCGGSVGFYLRLAEARKLAAC